MKRICLFFLIFFLYTGNLFSQIKQVKLRSGSPAQYERVDVDIELTATWKNPYFQEEVALNMKIVTPSGQEMTLPCYYESGNSGSLSLWKARFTPQEAGNYQYHFQLSQKGKVRNSSRPETFISGATDRTGFLHVYDHWTLRFDNGTPFRGIGENICWESRDEDDSRYFKELHEVSSLYNYDSMLPQFAGYGGNFYRIWICSWNLPIDYQGPFNNSRYLPSDTYYNPSALARMDRVVELSESLDLYMMLTLGQGGYLQKDRGVATSDEDFFINPKARQWYKNRLRYIVARWGYSPSIAMWEFFNEVDNVQYRDNDHPVPGQYIVDWHTEMAAYLKQIDPYQHIVTTSISHRDIEGLNSIPDMDINQKHIYNHTEVIPAEISQYINDFGKPYIIGEFGYEWDWSKNFNDFAAGMDIDFKRGLWYGLFSPTPVTPMSWWWEFFDNRGTNAYFRGVREISDRMLSAGKGSFVPLSVDAPGIESFAVRCGEEIYLYLFNPVDAVFLSDVTLSGGNQKYNVQSFEPTYRIYTELPAVSSVSGQIVLPKIPVASMKEKVLILTPY
ncbi:MAG: DUF5060 domain-containing protein [Tannerellaceae bacterium]|nr:DUF5060 domain-containing protein [Tannerellaceae bacterium]